MENATKALLIAAAVLIAILIISLGLVVYNRASETVNGAGDLTEYQIQQVNEKFTKYQGTSVSGSDVNALLQTVFNHNLTQEENATCVLVTVDGSSRVDSTSNLTTSPTKVPVGARYTVTCNISNTTKLINVIAVTTNT